MIDLHKIWNDAMTMLQSAQGDVSEDDRGMVTADDESLTNWVDDLQERVGLDVGRFGSQIEFFIIQRAISNLSPRATQIYNNVFEAMQDAEEIWGPEDYAELMNVIMLDAKKRIKAFEANEAEYGEDDAL